MNDIILESPPGSDVSDAFALCGLVSAHSTADVSVIYQPVHMTNPVYHPVTGDLITPGVDAGMRIVLRFPDRSESVRDHVLNNLPPSYTKRKNRPDGIPAFAGDCPVIDKIPPKPKGFYNEK